jgi:eukaryotic-like serine/threonine-protein kinase
LYAFGNFRCDPRDHLLLCEDKPISLAPKSFEILVALIQSNGKLLTKDELMRRVWPDSFVEEANLTVNISALRKVLGDAPGGQQYIETVPKMGYRFGIPVTESQNAGSSPAPAVNEEAATILTSRSGVSTLSIRARSSLRWWWAAGLIVVAIAISAVIIFRRPPRLTDKDTIVLADFTNTTGDTVFDDALRQGLSSQLEQSPFLNLLSDDRIAQTLSLMAQPKNSRLTYDLAREVCQRNASAAVLEGTIAQVGTQYLLTLKTVNCVNGDLLGSGEAQASDKDQVLEALGTLASQIRQQLGESLASVQKYDAPPEKVTTPSLEALKAYTLGYRAMVLRGEYAPAILLFQRAISLDANFAMAYARLGTAYFNLYETVQAAENARRAYQLRDHVSEREKLYIASHYQLFVTGNLEAARKVYELSAQTYPRDVPLNNLGLIYSQLGEFDEALAAYQNVLKVSPGTGNRYANLINGYLQLNRLDEARAAADQARSQNIDTPEIHLSLYWVHFLQHDAAAMVRNASAVMGKPGHENQMLNYESEAAAYNGQLSAARGLTQHAIDAAQKGGAKEAAALYAADAAVREALLGNMEAARQQAQTALAFSSGRDSEALSAVALGLAGDSSRATRLASDLENRFPEDTLVHSNYLPCIHAAMWLRRGEPARAIQALTAASPYEFGGNLETVNFVLYPVYLRGRAYLATKEGGLAVAEFQKILDHAGVTRGELIAALAQLEIARAFVLTGNAKGAKTAFQKFFDVWNQADTDLQVLTHAKAEYSKLD